MHAFSPLHSFYRTATWLFLVNWREWSASPGRRWTAHWRSPTVGLPPSGLTAWRTTSSKKMPIELRPTRSATTRKSPQIRGCSADSRCLQTWWVGKIKLIVLLIGLKIIVPEDSFSDLGRCRIVRQPREKTLIISLLNQMAPAVSILIYSDTTLLPLKEFFYVR